MSSEPQPTLPAPLTVVDVSREAASFAPGAPNRMLARVNDSGMRLAVFQGDGDWHSHAGTDECFLVLEGELTLEIFEGATLHVGPGQLVTIPGGAVHRPRAATRSVMLCFKRLEGHTDYFELVAPEADAPSMTLG